MDLQMTNSDQNQENTTDTYCPSPTECSKYWCSVSLLVMLFGVGLTIVANVMVSAALQIPRTECEVVENLKSVNKVRLYLPNTSAGFKKNVVVTYPPRDERKFAKGNTLWCFDGRGNEKLNIELQYVSVTYPTVQRLSYWSIGIVMIALSIVCLCLTTCLVALICLTNISLKPD